MLALGLLMIGAVPDHGWLRPAHIDKGYITAMAAFAGFVEALRM